MSSLHPLLVLVLLALLVALLCPAATATSLPLDGVVPSEWSNPDYATFRGQPYNVSYDARSLLVNGQRVFLIAGSTHYPRSTPDMWPDLFALWRGAGLNTLQMVSAASTRQARAASSGRTMCFHGG